MTSEPSSYEGGASDLEAATPPLDLRDLDAKTVEQLALMHGFRVKKAFSSTK